MSRLQSTITTPQIAITLMVSEISVKCLLFFAFSVKDNILQEERKLHNIPKMWVISKEEIQMGW